LPAKRATACPPRPRPTARVWRPLWPTRLEEAEQRIGATKSEALSHVRGIAVDTAQAIVTRLVGVTPDTASVEGAVDRALTTH